MPNKHTRKASARKLAPGSGTRYYGKSSASKVKKTGANATSSLSPGDSSLPEVSSAVPLPEVAVTSEQQAVPMVSIGVNSMLAAGAGGGVITGVQRAGKPWTLGRVFRWSMLVVG